MTNTTKSSINTDKKSIITQELKRDIKKDITIISLHSTRNKTEKQRPQTIPIPGMIKTKAPTKIQEHNQTIF